MKRSLHWLHTRLWMTPVLLAAALSACGGGGGGGGSAAAGGSQVATFIDAAVSGLEFKSASYSGVTDSNGNFVYRPGESVTFSIGNLVLGSATPSASAGNKITPLNLVAGAADASDARVTRILRTLQTLDGDGVPANGIQIMAADRDYARTGAAVHLDAADTPDADAEVEKHLASGHLDVDEATARKHFNDHQGDSSNADKGYDESKKTPPTSTSTPATVTQPASTAGRLLASNCFQCHGTLGRGGFENLRGKSAAEVTKFLKQPAANNIMAAHAQGYTDTQLAAIVAYLQQ